MFRHTILMLMASREAAAVPGIGFQKSRPFRVLTP